MSFVSTHVEMDYQLSVCDRFLPQFRLALVAALLLLLFKLTLLAITLSGLQESPPRSGGSSGGEYRRAALTLFGLSSTAVSDLERQQSDLVGQLATVAACSFLLLLALAMSVCWRGWYAQFCSLVHLVLFLIIGLACVILPNTIDEAIKNFVVVAEVYLLFPFGLLLRISFPRGLIGGWTIVLIFLVLRFASTQASHTVTATELVTVVVYLAVGLVAFNYLAYKQERWDRRIFEYEFSNKSSLGSHGIVDLSLIPMATLNAYTRVAEGTEDSV